MRRLNVRLASSILGGLVVVGLGLHALHSYQVDRNADGLLRHADRALEKNQPGQAQRYFAHYLAYRPDDTDTRARHALSLERVPGDRLRAAVALQDVLRRDPSCSDVRFRLIHCLAGLQRLQEAITHAEKLLPDWEPKGEIEHVLGWCHEAQGQYEKAAYWFRKAIVLRPRNVDSYVLLAEILQVRLDEADKAAEVIDDLVRDNADSYRAHLIRFRFRLKRQDSQGADKDLRRAAELAPGEPAVLLAAADWAQTQGKTDQARADLERGLKLHPGDEAICKTLAGLEIAAGKRRRAAEILRRGLLEAPSAAALAVLLTDVLIDEGELTEAEQQLADLKRRGFVSPLTDYLLARLRIQRRQWSDAMPLLERARLELGSGSEWSSRIHALLGLCYRQTGDADQELASFRRTVLEEPSWTTGHLGLGTALLGQGRLDEALSELQQVARAADTPPAAWSTLARCMVVRTLRLPEDKRKWAEIEPILERADKAQPGTIEIQLLRADILVARKRFAEAQNLLEKVRTASAPSAVLECALADLARRQNDIPAAVAILDQAEKNLGDSLELRQARLRLFASGATPQARRALAALADNLTALPAEARIRLLRQLADTWLTLGDSASAEKLWRLVLQQQPRDLRGRAQLLDVYLQAGRLDQARPVVAELRELEGEQGVLWRYGTAALLVAEFQAQTGTLDGARKHIAEAQRRQRDWTKLFVLEAHIDELEGKLAQAIRHYQSAFDAGERSPRVIHRLVQLLQERRHFTAADDVLRKLEEENTLPAELARLGAEVALANNHVPRALALAQQAVPAASRDYRDLLWLAKVHQAAEKTAEAEAFLRQAVRVAAHTPDTWVALIQHLVRTGNRYAAESVLQETRQSILPARAAFTLARCFEALGEPEQAEKHFQEALRDRPDDFIVLAAAADFFRCADQPARAEPLLRKLLQPEVTAPTDLVRRVRRQLALIVAASGQTDARKQALDLLSLHRAFRTTNLADERARILIEGLVPGKQAHAMQMFEATLASQPASPDELFHFAKLCQAADNPARGRTLLLELVTNQSYDCRFLAHYVRTQAVSGDLEDALAYLRKLEVLEPTSPRTRSVKKLLQPR